MSLQKERPQQLHHPTNHFEGSRLIGLFDGGEVGVVGYSLDINQLHKSPNESFDVMIQYGEEDPYDIVREGDQKVGSLFQTLVQQFVIPGHW